MAALLHIVDALPYAKLNVLHWHLTDTQSFPVETPSRPSLWRGSFSKRERYSTEDVRRVVEHARLRGIRVIPEFDTPGHAESWCVGYRSVCPAPTCKTPLDVSKAETFAVLDDVLGDASKLFPDAFVHLGGDEVDTSCWGSTPSIRQWLQERNYTTADAYSYFVSTAAKIARSHQKRPIQWAEVFDEFGATLDKSTIVHVWKPSTNIRSRRGGYDCLVNVGYVPTRGIWTIWIRPGITSMASICARHRTSRRRCWAATARCGVASKVCWCLQRTMVAPERRVPRCPRRRDGGRLGLRQYRVAAPRGDRGAAVEQCGRRRRGAAATGGVPVLAARARRRRRAARPEQLNGADGARRPGRLHAAAATQS